MNELLLAITDAATGKAIGACLAFGAVMIWVCVSSNSDED